MAPLVSRNLRPCTRLVTRSSGPPSTTVTPPKTLHERALTPTGRPATRAHIRVVRWFSTPTSGRSILVSVVAYTSGPVTIRLERKGRVVLRRTVRLRGRNGKPAAWNRITLPLTRVAPGDDTLVFPDVVELFPGGRLDRSHRLPFTVCPVGAARC